MGHDAELLAAAGSIKDGIYPRPLSLEYLFHDGLAIDTSGSGNDGIKSPTGLTTVADRFGVSDRALDFNGSTGFVNAGNYSSLVLGDGSSDSPSWGMAWVKMDDATRFRIMSKDNGTLREIAFDTTGSDKVEFIKIDSSAGGLIGQTTIGSVTSLQGSFHSIGWTDTGSGLSSGIQLYIDGLPVSQAVTQAGSYTATEDTGVDMTIGKTENGNTFADGIIDDFVFGKVFKTPVQMLAIHNGSKP